MQTHSPFLRLLALNLALLLLGSLVLPTWSAAIPPDEPDYIDSSVLSPELQAAYERARAKASSREAGPAAEETPTMMSVPASYWVSAGGAYFESDENRSGIGWEFVGSATSPTLFLYEGYSGEPIRASGDLELYSRGNVFVTGVNSEKDAGSAIEVEGTLDASILYGTLSLTGGDAITGDGGAAVQVNDFVSFYLRGLDGDDRLVAANLNLTGGDSRDGRGGRGILAPNIGASIFSAPYFITETDSTETYIGRINPECSVSIRGGTGYHGGDGICSPYVALDVDGIIQGGASAEELSYRAGRALHCGCYEIAYSGHTSDKYVPFSKRTAATVTLKAGSELVYAVDAVGPGGEHVEPQYDVPTHVCAWNMTPQNLTPSELAFYPRTYSVSFCPDKDSVSTHTVNVTYPGAVKIGEYANSRDGQFLCGYSSNDYNSDDCNSNERGRFLTADQWFTPCYDSTLTARWAPYNSNTVLLLGNHGTVRYAPYDSYSVNKPFTVPVPLATTTPPYLDSYSLGYCNVLEPQYDKATGLLNAGDLWLENDSTVTIGTQSAYYARWEYPDCATVNYCGGGGTRTSGSAMAVQCAPQSFAPLTTLSNDTLGFSREGYLLTGWKTPEGILLEPGTGLAPGSHTKLTAQWKQILKSGTFEGVDLNWTLLEGNQLLLTGTAPGSVYAAAYGAGGKLISACQIEDLSHPAALPSGALSYKLFVINGSNAPLCPAEEITMT